MTQTVHLMSDALLDACNTAPHGGGLSLAPETTPDRITCPACRLLLEAGGDTLEAALTPTAQADAAIRVTVAARIASEQPATPRPLFEPIRMPLALRKAMEAAVAREAGYTALEDVGVLPVALRRHAHPLTWAWSEDDEGVGISCESCEEITQVDTLDGRETTDGATCPSCGSAATERVILGWTPRVWDRPIARP